MRLFGGDPLARFTWLAAEFWLILAAASFCIVALLLLSGCAPTITGSQFYDGRFWWSNVKSASDIAGGPRHDVLIAVDRNGAIVASYDASAVGTLQAVAAGIGAAVISAAGQAGGSALIRPARNTTQVRMDVQGTGGGGGAGGSNTTTATSTSAGSTATSTLRGE